MTLVDDPPRLEVDASAPVRVGGNVNVSSWNLAARLARREVRRRPGRTALVAALVALPVLAMTVALIVAGSHGPSPQAMFERDHGDADLVVFGFDPDVVAPALPAGSRAIAVTTAATPLEVADGTTTPYLDFRVVPFDDPIVDGMFDVVAGETPSTAGEVLLDTALAADLGVGVGDAVELARPAGSWTVSGLASTSAGHLPVFAVAEFDETRFASDRSSSVTLVDFPDDIGLETLERAWEEAGDGVGVPAHLSPRLMEELEARAVAGGRPANSLPWATFGADDGVEPRALAWGWIAGALGLAAMGVIIAAAFAVSSRRQLTTIGQLSANGASPGLIQRTLCLQGVWSGAAGAALGVGGGLLLAALAAGPIDLLVDRTVSWRWSDVPALLIIAATGVTAGAVAALVPARTAARIPTLTALAGRRPRAGSPRRLVTAGLALAIGGTGLLTLAALAAQGTSQHDDALAALAILGGLGIVGGICCASPLVADLIGRSAGHLRGNWRLAARSLGRARARSAGVITAIAMAGANVIAAMTLVGTLATDERRVPSVPDDTVIVETLGMRDDPVTNTSERFGVPLDDAVVARVREIVPDAVVTPRRVAVGPPTDPRGGQPAGYLILDDGMRALIGLSDDEWARLADVDVLHLWTGPQSDLLAPFEIETVTGPAQVVASRLPPAARSTGGNGFTGDAITADLARTLGFEIIDGGVVVTAPDPLTGDQRRALSRLDDELRSARPDAFVEPGDPVVTADSWSTEATLLLFDRPPSGLSLATIQLIAIGIGLGFTLLVVAIGLSLAATESADERAVLFALGASPRSTRTLAAAKAALLTVVGAALAVPAGFVPVAIVIRADDSGSGLTFPWLTALGLLVVVPVIAATSTALASRVAQRVRPAQLSDLPMD